MSVWFIEYSRVWIWMLHYAAVTRASILFGIVDDGEVMMATTLMTRKTFSTTFQRLFYGHVVIFSMAHRYCAGIVATEHACILA